MFFVCLFNVCVSLCVFVYKCVVCQLLIEGLGVCMKLCVRACVCVCFLCE